MDKLEKVINRLECCLDVQSGWKDAVWVCPACPYASNDGKPCETLAPLLEDALALLKAQQPRVMTLDEVIAHYSLPPVFPYDFGMQEDYYEDIQPLYFEFPCDNEDSWIVHWRGHAQVARYLDEWRYSYNKKWRCWTSRPTDEQREAEPWKE